MKVILACDPNGGIGYENKLPWSNIEGDLPRFKQLTAGQVIVMGRNTWDSLPKKPLPGRLNLVVSSKTFSVPPGALVINDLAHFTHFKNAWLIGGAKLITNCWDMIDEVHLTKTFTEYTCDTFINLLQLENDFTCWFKEQHNDHTYEIWKRK